MRIFVLVQTIAYEGSFNRAIKDTLSECLIIANKGDYYGYMTIEVWDSGETEPTTVIKDL